MIREVCIVMLRLTTKHKFRFTINTVLRLGLLLFAVGCSSSSGGTGKHIVGSQKSLASSSSASLALALQSSQQDYSQGENTSIIGEGARDTSSINKNIFWRDKLKRLARGEKIVFRVVQLGDSHTAGEFFTQTVRQQLQERFGDAGIGWIYPTKVGGQRQSQVSYESKNWKVMTSRRAAPADFPLGGVVAFTGNNSSASNNDGRGGYEDYKVTISSRKSLDNPQQVTFSLRPISVERPFFIADTKGNKVGVMPQQPNQWQYETIMIHLPFTYRVNRNDVWQLGYINIENQNPGITLSAFGINGATLNQTGKWRQGWLRDLQQTQADLVILSYGTNESMAKNIQKDKITKLWQQRVRDIKQALPKAGVLIIGAPESLIRTGKKSGKNSCGKRAHSLDVMQNIQKTVAQQENVLFWSWEKAMGGKCSMQKFISRDLARSDGVHFTMDGYKETAKKLADYLIRLSK